MSSMREFMLNFPAGKPPPGVKSNFINPPNYYNLGLGIQGACIGLTTLGVISRICVKIFMMRDMRLEDYLIIVAYVFEIAHVGSAFYVMTFAPILHQWDIPIRNIIKFLKAVHLGSLTYDVTIVCLKLCILIQFKRIFIPAANRLAIRITYALMAANTLLFAVCVFTRIFACRPIQKQWDPLMKGGSCLNITLQMMFAGSFNLALDTLILLWTQAIIWRLNMPTKRRLKMAALFATGLVACASAAVRVHMVTKMLHTPDHAYYASWSALWSYPEATAGFLVLCLPVVPRIVKVVLQKAGLRSVKSNQSPQIASGRGSSEKPNRPQRSWWHVSGGDSQLQSGGSTAAFAVETPEIQVTKVIEIERADSMS